MCGPLDKARERAKDPDRRNEMNPKECGDTIQAGLNEGAFEHIADTEKLARAVRCLSRWLTRVYGCIERRMEKLEANTASASVVTDLRARIETLEERVNNLEGWMNGEDSGSRSHAIAVADLASSVQRQVGEIHERLDHVAGNCDHHIHPKGAHSKPIGPFGPMSKETNTLRSAAQKIFNSDVMQQTCPDVPQGPQAPRYCHQCGAKL